jgi:hypothetical protein
LAVVHELHAAQGGYDPRWMERLLDPGAGLLRRLAADLSLMNFGKKAIKDYFPPEIWSPLESALDALNRSRASVSKEPHVHDWIRRALQWLMPRTATARSA